MKKYEFVAKSLSEKIREGQFADGAFLPTEERLTQMYSVSRPPCPAPCPVPHCEKSAVRA